jgi:hypothetical protein
MSIPADASSLVDTVYYARVTGDTSSDDSATTEALNDALGLIQDEIGRVLALGSYVETLRVYRNGTVYPSATPIASIEAPDIDQVSIQGAGVYIGYWNPAPAVTYGEFNSGIPPQTTLTYTGGYTADTLPTKLKRAICRTAFNILHPSSLAGLPGGVNRVQVGDVGYSAAGSTALRINDPLDDSIRADIKGYRNPNFRGWQIDVAPAPS